MEIIFDSEEQKEKIIRMLSEDHCPYMANLSSSDCLKVSCKECWESAVKMEVIYGQST